MLPENSYSLLPFTKEDFSALSQRGCFCFPPFDPTEDDDPVSLDTFFCNAMEDGSNAHFFRVYKLVDDADVDDILAIACISNSSITFESYESKPAELQGSGFNEAIPSVMLIAFGVRKDCQKQGIGSLAFRKLCNFICESSIAGVRMLMLHPLQSAVKFYQSQGCISVFANEYDSDVDLMYFDVWRKPPDLF